MTVAVDNGNIGSFPSTGAGPFSGSITVGASDNLLVVLIGNRYNGSPAVPADSVTFNSVAMTKLTDVGTGGNWDSSVWYLSNPATGTKTLAATWTTNTTGGYFGVAAVPISGAATSSIFGTVATNSSTSTNSPSVTATGGISGSLYLGLQYNGQAASTASGTGQTDALAATMSGTGANDSYNVSTIAGSGTGAFTWTGSGSVDSTIWMAIGVNINALAATTVPIAWVT